MAVVDFDPAKVKKTSIDNIVANTWNPKEKNTEDYKKVKESIFQKGLRGFIAVRTHPTEAGKYEILDGEQRFTAAKDLGYEEIHVYDEGEVSDKEARELTVWWQQQVPFERIAEAYLITELVEAHGIDAVELPYTDAEIETFKNLAQFDFNQYQDSEDDHEPEGDPHTLKIQLSAEQFKIVNEALDRIKKEADCGDARALELLAADFLSGSEPINDTTKETDE